MSNNATVKTVWFWRKGEDSPELLVAWDDFTVDNNPDGFEEAIKRAYAEVESEDNGSGIRRVNLNFDFDPIERAFWPVDVEAAPEVLPNEAIDR